MTGTEVNIHALDSAYKPFPSFADWASRTSVDTVRWDRYKALLEDRPEMSTTALERARNVVKRAAAMDTGAIEGLYEVDRGFTFTVAFEMTAWEVELAKKGETVRSLFEAQLHAYDYVLDLATKAEKISEAAIRKLHEVVCAAQTTYRVVTAIGPQEQELVKGRYKVLPNHVRTRDGLDHSYAPVDVTPSEMARLISEMRSEAFLTAHPVLQAAYAHYGLVVIHPFADGNGRVARALASVFTYRAISIPIMILSEHKNAYLDALESADRTDYQDFVDFMLARSLEAMTLAIDIFGATRIPSPEEGAAALESLYFTKGGYTQVQVDKAGGELFQLVQRELEKTISKHTSANLLGRVSPMDVSGERIALDSSHRIPVGGERDLRLMHIELSSAPPARARVYRNYAVSVPTDAAGGDDIQVARVLERRQPANHFEKLQRDMHFVPTDPLGTEVRFWARVDELIPSLSGVLQIRAGVFAESVVGEMLEELKLLAEKALRGNP